MKNIALSVIIGLGGSFILIGCGSQTPKEQVYGIVYNALSNGDKKVSPEKAKCIAEKVVTKFSNEDLDNMIKMKKLKDSGYESEIQTSPKLLITISLFAQYGQEVFYECQ